MAGDNRCLQGHELKVVAVLEAVWCSRWIMTVHFLALKLAPQDKAKPNIPHQHPPLLFKTLSSTTVLPAKLGSMCGPTSTTYSAGQMQCTEPYCHKTIRFAL